MSETPADLLAPLIDHERARPTRACWSLATMRALLAASGGGSAGATFVQVGGSKGKGTTACYLESLARGAGLRVGVYLSPHLVRLNERVRVCGRPVSDAELCEAISAVLRSAGELDLAPTFFEAMTAAALRCFGTAGVDLAVLEVGLGGRLDATTAVPVQASILTMVELEHTAILGATVEAIAAEKAWILRPGRPAFTAARGPALAVLRSWAERVGAELLVSGEQISLALKEDAGPDGFAGELRDATGADHPFVLEGAARVELSALCLAFSCLRRLWPERRFPLLPVGRPDLPGRCEVTVCADGRPLVLDAAHTEASLAALAAELERRFPGQRVAVLFAVAAGKRWRHGLKCLLDRADRFLVTGLEGTAAVEPATLRAWLAGRGVATEVVEDVAAGLRRLAHHDGPRVVTGSFYLVGEARALRHLVEARR